MTLTLLHCAKSGFKRCSLRTYLDVSQESIIRFDQNISIKQAHEMVERGYRELREITEEKEVLRISA